MVSESLYFSIVFTLTIAYTLTFGYCMFKTNKFNYFNDEWRHTKFFYISVIVQTFIRMTTYSLLTFAIPKEQRENSWIVFMRSVPDTLFFVNFILLIYQTINIFYYSHMENAASISLLVHFTRPRFSQARRIIALLVFLWLGIMGLIYTLLILEKVKHSQIDALFAVVNLLSGTFVLLFIMYLYSNYSETPFKSVSDRENLQKISRVLLIWTLGRYFKGFLGLLDLKSASFLSYLSNPQRSTVGGGLTFIAQNLVCEVFCFIIVMDYRFINIFICQDQANVRSSTLTAPDRALTKSEFDTLTAQIGTFIEKKDIHLKNLMKKKGSGLGELRLAEFNGYEIVVRAVRFNRLSGYVLQDIKQEIEELKARNCKSLVKFYGAVVNLPEIWLLMPLASRSLFKVLHEDNVILSIKEKVNMIREIGFVLQKVHKNQLAHGHLTSHNILMFDGYTPVIADYGLAKLKMYAGMVMGYTNKSVWSSPEILREVGTTVKNPKTTDDIFSFGIIIWEIISGEIPHKNLKVSTFKEDISNGALPEILGFFPKFITKVLGLCWAPLETRANIELIYNKLSNAKFE